MRRWTLVLLVGLLGVLAAGYYVLDVRGRDARERQQAAERRVVDFDAAAVRELAIEKRGERVVARLEDGRWRIVAPVEDRADETTVQGLLAFVRQLEKVRTLDGLSDLATVGLDAPETRLTLGLKTGEALTLLLGGPNPARTGIYAAVEGVPVVFLAPSRLATELAKSPYVNELRDRTILPIEADRVRRLEIVRADTRIVVERVGPRQWRLERPFNGAGDDGIIRDLLWKIGSARAQSVVAGTEPPARYGLDRPHARVSVVDDAGGRRTLAVSLAPEDPRKLFARMDGSASVHVTDGQLLADLALDPGLLRNRQLLVYDQRDVERITIRYPGDLLVLDRAGEGWRVTRPVEGPAMRATVENILEVLPNLRYASVESAAGGDLQRYGLDRPRLAVTLGLKGGRELPTLAVGREQGGMHFVMVGDSAPVYTVDARLIRVIPEDPTDAKRYSLPEQLKRDLDKTESGRR